MSFIKWAVVLFSSLAVASPEPDSSFFKIHQATGFFEQFIGGNCPQGMKKAENLLNALDMQKTDATLIEKANGLRSMIGSKMRPTAADVEALRLSIHDLMERRNFHHGQRWHDQIVEECKMAKN